MDVIFHDFNPEEILNLKLIFEQSKNEEKKICQILSQSDCSEEVKAQVSKAQERLKNNITELGKMLSEHAYEIVFR